MIEITVQKTNEQRNNHYSFTQTLSFNNTIGGKCNQESLNYSIAHTIVSLIVQHGFSWKDINECIKIKNVSEKKKLIQKTLF